MGEIVYATEPTSPPQKSSLRAVTLLGLRQQNEAIALTPLSSSHCFPHLTRAL